MKFRMVLSVLLVGLVVLAFLNVDLAAEKMKVVKILDGEATIKMPASFTRMSNGLLAEKYTQPEGRPQEAWYVEKENGKVIIAFSATPNTVSETHIPQVLQVIKEQVEAYSPSSSLVTVNGHNMGKLELKTPGLAGGMAIYTTKCSYHPSKGNC